MSQLVVEDVEVTAASTRMYPHASADIAAGSSAVDVASKNGNYLMLAMLNAASRQHDTQRDVKHLLIGGMSGPRRQRNQAAHPLATYVESRLLAASCTRS